MVRSELQRLTPEQQAEFFEEYGRRTKSKGWAWFLWFIGWHFAYLRKWGIQVVYWLSIFLLVGLIWWVVEAFKVNERLRNYNKDVALAVLRDLKIISAPDVDGA